MINFTHTHTHTQKQTSKASCQSVNFCFPLSHSDTYAQTHTTSGLAGTEWFQNVRKGQVAVFTKHYCPHIRSHNGPIEGGPRLKPI